MRGLTYFVRGLRLIQQPGLRRYFLVPVLINTVLFGLAIWWLIHYFELAIQYFIPEWLNWLSFILWPLLAIGILAGVFFSFSVVANLIAAPFYGQLAAAVEARLSDNRTFDPQSSLRQVIASFKVECRKLGYYLLRAIPLMLLSLIPGLNLVTFPLWLVFSAWFLAYDAAAYPLDNHHYGFDQQIAMLREHRWSILSYGGLNLGATMIPVLNLITPAAAVAGMTALFYEAGRLKTAGSGSSDSGTAVSVSPD